MISYGADVNLTCEYNKKYDPQKPNESPVLLRTTAFMYACTGGCMKVVKCLLSHGADPNKWVGYEGNCALSKALIQERMDIAKYLIEEVKVKIPPYCLVTLGGDTVTILGLLRSLIMFKLGSRDHQLKMEIVKYLKDNYNLDYFKEPVPGGSIIERIKRMHPNDWEEYIKKY